MKRQRLFLQVLLGVLLAAVTSLPAAGQSSRPVAQPPPDPAITFNTGNPVGGWLYVMNDDGSNKRAILKTGHNGMPSWSPDGSRIVFVSDVNGKGIYIINKDGTGLCKLVALNDSSNWLFAGPVWSPLPLADGKPRIAYANTPSPGASNYDLFVVNADCSNPGNPVNLTNTPTTTEWFPSWSRFANRIAAQYGSSPDVVVYDVGVNGGVVSITGKTYLKDLGLFPPVTDPNVVRYVAEPDWGKADDRLAVESNLSVNFDWPQIWITDLTTAGTYNLTQGKVAFADNPSWSPDDKEIVFRQHETAHGTTVGLFKINLTTGAVTQLTGFSLTDPKGSYPDWRRCFWSTTQCPSGSTCQLCK